MNEYKGFEIEKITRNTLRIRKAGGAWIDMFGHYPKTLKEAKAIIDTMAAEENGQKEYEIHVSASYRTDGGSTEWNAFTEYRMATSAAEAKKNLRAELKAEGYHNITMDAIEA